jgi:hypothetical protein
MVFVIVICLLELEASVQRFLAQGFTDGTTSRTVAIAALAIVA